ncbi:hypothetical protein [Kribbella catacumbae]|uniref:hypothetical protein n=1 Tax=Kribbella catacumbae TaxID=460086 RepID=UPI000367C5B3|nr:hypothetical protein [Kribbella catacumbae]
MSVGDRYAGQLPPFEADRPWWSEVEATTRHLDDVLGVPTFVLRLVHADNAELGRGGRVVFHVQAATGPRPGVLDPTPRPDWPDIIKPHPLRSTWAEVDGPQRLVDWATGIVGPARPTQYKTWNLSCLIHLPAAGAWAKATSEKRELAIRERPLCPDRQDIVAAQPARHAHEGGRKGAFGRLCPVDRDSLTAIDSQPPAGG